jgi:ubiquinone/menaquinone biosynthesis C-methylase UbiE
MADNVAVHYSGQGNLVAAIAGALKGAGKALDQLTTADLGTIDEFHIRGRAATLELAKAMRLNRGSHVLDVGSGLGGPARTIAEEFGCRVTGVDLTQEFCDAANAMTGWVRLADRVECRQGDATALPFGDRQFDAAVTIHAAMNIPAKDRMYAEVHRVIRPKGIFAVYDIVQGEGGEVLFPVPWAREPSISHLATPKRMESLLANAGFKILAVHDSTEESQRWFEALAARTAQSGPLSVTFQAFLGSDFPAMAKNQVRNLAERRIRTISYVCEA